MFLSDSDDEIDLSSFVIPPKRAEPRSDTARMQELKEDVYKKSGENAILREQLTMQSSKFANELQEITASHQRTSESQEAELKKLRQRLKSIDTELQFARQEMRMSSINNGNSLLPVTGATRATPALSLPPRFADGFTVKRQKTLRGKPSDQPANETSTDILAVESLPQSDILVVQFLYTIEHPLDKRQTIGTAISAKVSAEEQLEEAAMILGKDVDMKAKLALLLLIYGFCQRGVIPASYVTARVESLVVDCLLGLKPLPPVQDAIDHLVVKAADAISLSFVLYGFDMLACVPNIDLDPRLFELVVQTRIPLVISKAFIAYAQCPTVLIDERKLFFDTPPELKLELLFGGILDDGLHALQLEQYSQQYLDLGIRKKQLNLAEIASEAYMIQRAAGIWLAASREPSSFMRAEVENIFVSHVDDPTSAAHLVLISRCVWYLWITLDESNRSGNNLDELVVACAQVTYSQDYPKQVTSWALDILHQVVDPGEMNLIANEMS